MTHPPITRRYLSDLLSHGQNNLFTITSIERNSHIVDDQFIGFFWKVSVTHIATGQTFNEAGASVLQGVERALFKHGVALR